MSPRPTQMPVIRRRIRRRILHLPRWAEDLYVLPFFDDFLLGLKNTAERWFYEVKNVCV
jgi:hypothetical protein